MNLELYIGKAHLFIESFQNPVLKPEVYLFRKPLACPESYVGYHVRIIPASEFCISGIPDYEADDLLVFENIRYYRNPRDQDCKVYARSEKSGHEITVEYLEDSQMWNHHGFSIMNLIHLETILAETGGIILHSCYTEYQEEAVLFTAPSGTGKTTQADKWRRLFESRIINGDLTLIYPAETDSDNVSVTANGFIYHGSASECLNETFPVKAIVILRQAQEDRVVPIPKVKAMMMLLSEMFINKWDREQMERAMDLVGRILSQTMVFQYDCTLNDNAALVLHNYLYGDDNGTI